MRLQTNQSAVRELQPDQLTQVRECVVGDLYQGVGGQLELPQLGQGREGARRDGRQMIGSQIQMDLKDEKKEKNGMSIKIITN